MNSNIPPPPVNVEVHPTDEDDGTVALLVDSTGGRVEFRVAVNDLSDLIVGAIETASVESTLRDMVPEIIQAVAAGMNPDAYHRLTEYRFAVDVWAAEWLAVVDAWADAAAAHRAMRDMAVGVEKARGVPGGIYRRPGSEVFRVFD